MSCKSGFYALTFSLIHCKTMLFMFGLQKFDTNLISSNYTILTDWLTETLIACLTACLPSEDLNRYIYLYSFYLLNPCKHVQSYPILSCSVLFRSLTLFLLLFFLLLLLISPSHITSLNYPPVHSTQHTTSASNNLSHHLMILQPLLWSGTSFA